MTKKMYNAICRCPCGLQDGMQQLSPSGSVLSVGDETGSTGLALGGVLDVRVTFRPTYSASSCSFQHLYDITGLVMLLLNFVYFETLLA
ncbi:hypothetical protein [Geomonas propionica]|uniref:Uncharacterized protein n=1 Tax=Geomonas propionica TaxID=2798582 RepID=A0ABS0YYJ3_9BACT|nr:hypothetical protein [Geomonas propionica]MBJ6802817.1 hypothetical protein [Geomonas propionica]